MNEADDNLKMKDFTRPILCVIDENGVEVTESEISGFSDEHEKRKTSLTNVLHPDLSDRLSFVQTHVSPVNSFENGSPLLCRKAPVRDYNANVTSSEETDLSELKATAARLKLSTRRQSYITWRDQYVEKKNSVKPNLEKIVTDKTVTENGTDKDGDKFTEDRKNRINEALEWLRNELVSEEMSQRTTIPTK